MVEHFSYRSPRRTDGQRHLRLALLGLGLVALAGCQQRAVEKAADTPMTAASAIERGHYLVQIMYCNDCHTPLKMGATGPEPDMTRMLSGHPSSPALPPPPPLPEGPWNWVGSADLTAFAGPWGISYAANLTPDQNTGMGIWTEDMFINAMRLGKHMGTSRTIMPPMPWPWIRKLTDEDLKAVFAYLRSIPPIENQVPDWQPPAAAAAKP